MRNAARCLLAALALLLTVGPEFASHGYADQDRDHILSAPDRNHRLGTDSLGRDNVARFLYGGRLSMGMAALAALAACAIAAVIGTAAALGGPMARAAGSAAFDVMLSTPWYLLVFLVRAILPLDSPPMATAAVTFAILGLVGWAQGARTIRDAVLRMANGSWVRQARAAGFGGFALLRKHIVPNLLPLLQTQFLLLLPALLLGEATLGMLGLGIPEPLPSWGGSLVELVQSSTIADRPWALIPAVLLALASIGLRTVAGDAPGTKSSRRKEVVFG